MGEQPGWVAGGTVLSPPLASFANLGEFVDEHVEKNLEKLVGEQLERNLGEVVDEQLSSQGVGNTRLCLRLAANLTHGTAPAKNNVNNPQC